MPLRNQRDREPTKRRERDFEEEDGPRHVDPRNMNRRRDDDEDEVDWEDLSSNEDDVDERWEDMEEDEVIDEGEEDEEGEDAAYEQMRQDAEAEGLNEALKRVKFDEEDAEDAGDQQVFRGDRGDMVGDGEEMTYSNKAYDSFFQLRTEYSCLSFDIVPDNLGEPRTRYPMTMYFVGGSQADEQSKNELIVLKVSNICKTKHDVESDEDSDDEFIGDDVESEDDEDDVDEVNGGEPLVDYRAISHFGSANRVRCSKHQTSLTAVWSDAGHVQVFDIENDYKSMADFANAAREEARAWRQAGEKQNPLRFCSPSSTHRVEGYGLDWSPMLENTFASGDCAGNLFVWKPTSDGRWSASGSNTHKRGAPSIEEIRWSPTQADVLIACRAGGMCEVWDTRDMRSAKMFWQADPTDINVADWNPARQASHLFATGADSGTIAVWDLRRIANSEYVPLQQLNFHAGSPITSMEFSTYNESVLSATSRDGQCTLWDLSLERDEQEERDVVGQLFERDDISHLPDQLMFQHQGLKDPKEVHFHKQIPGMVVTTDFDGLHMFKPMNWRELMK